MSPGLLTNLVTSRCLGRLTGICDGPPDGAGLFPCDLVLSIVASVKSEVLRLAVRRGTPKSPLKSQDSR